MVLGPQRPSAHTRNGAMQSSDRMLNTGRNAAFGQPSKVGRGAEPLGVRPSGASAHTECGRVVQCGLVPPAPQGKEPWLALLASTIRALFSGRAGGADSSEPGSSTRQRRDSVEARQQRPAQWRTPQGVRCRTTSAAIHKHSRLRGSLHAGETAGPDIGQVFGPIRRRHHGLRPTRGARKDGTIRLPFGGTKLRPLRHQR